MKLLLAWLRDATEQLGTTGVLGIALIAFAAAFATSTLPPLLDEAAALRDETAALQSRLGAADTSSAQPALGEQLATFYAFFPAAASSPDWLGKLHTIAQASGVQLDSGEYRFERSAAARLARYQMTLPVQGTYAQLRTFVGTLLEEVPALALEDVALKRDSVESPRLEARLRLTLFLGDS